MTSKDAAQDWLAICQKVSLIHAKVQRLAPALPPALLPLRLLPRRASECWKIRFPHATHHSRERRDRNELHQHVPNRRNAGALQISRRVTSGFEKSSPPVHKVVTKPEELVLVCPLYHGPDGSGGGRFRMDSPCRVRRQA
jgi:hypothetical protein